MRYVFGDFELNEQEFSLTRDGRRLALEPRALRVLLVLLENQGRLMDKKSLLDAVWKDTYVEETTLTRAIAVIRKTLEDDPRAPRYIQTVHTRGYRFIAEVQVQQAIEPPVTAVEEPPQPRERASARPSEEPANGNAPPESSTPLGPQRRSRTIPLYAAAVACLALVAAVPLLKYRNHKAQPLTTTDTLVLADFSNNTGDPVFDDALRQGMLVQLEQSPVLRLATDSQIRTTLKRMALPTSSRLSSEIGREVCQRIGGTAVLDGSISRLGNDYVISLRARRCSSGEEVDAEQVQISRKEAALNALSQIATRLRSRMGESSATIKDLDTPLAEATTASLDALKAFSQGVITFNTKGSRAALPLFLHATVIDPQFAAAHVWLGRMYADLGEDTSAIQSTQRAYELRDRTSDRERFAIDVSYDLLVTGNLEKARNACDAWIQMYPRDVYPHAFLSGLIHPVYGQYEKALAQAKDAITTDPDFVLGYRNAATNLIALNRPAEAEQVLAQASQRKLYLASFVTDTFRIAFLKSDADGMKRAAEAAPTNPWLLFYQAAALARAGKLQQARIMKEHALELARHGGRHDFEAELLANSAFTDVFSGLPNDATRQAQAALLLSRNRTVEYSVALVFAMTGRTADATRLADNLAQSFPEDTVVRENYVPTVRSAVALAKKQPQHAVELLQNTAQFEPGLPLYPIYLRGQAYLDLGQGERAAVEFRKIVDNPGLVLCDPILNAAQLRLARAEELAGNQQGAAAALDAVKLRWNGADPEFPLLKEATLQRASSSVTSTSRL